MQLTGFPSSCDELLVAFFVVPALSTVLLTLGVALVELLLDLGATQVCSDSVSKVMEKVSDDVVFATSIAPFVEILTHRKLLFLQISR